jgi:hypothetical protein
MHGWTLADLYDLEEAEYDELVAWLLEQQDRSTHGEDGINVDELNEDTKADVLKAAMRG